MHIQALHHPDLSIDEFSIQSGEAWCIYGSNKSGINSFLNLLEGELQPDTYKELLIPEKCTVISFGVQQQIFEDEIQNDDSDFLDHPDPGTLAREFLPAESLNNKIIDELGMRDCLNTGYRQLSSGQSRKLLLLQAIFNNSGTLILDSPYEGLDVASCRELDQSLTTIDRSTLKIAVLVRNSGDIPDWCTHLALFSGNKISQKGDIDSIRPHAIELAQNCSTQLFEEVEQKTDPQNSVPKELIILKQGFASYGDTEVFSGLDLTIQQGEHTLITGPNGCGKSTLLHILTGDNPKCYANNLTIFGIKRGSGESIWDIKRHMGIVSPEIHRSYRVPGSALHVILSGLYDSIGLYTKVSELEERQAQKWLDAIDMSDKSNTPFRNLSFGEQRLVLIARGFIKCPPLLVLDEPTQGLDERSRKGLLDFLESISDNGHTTMLYVSHREDEYRSFFRHHLKLEQYS